MTITTEPEPQIEPATVGDELRRIASIARSYSTAGPHESHQSLGLIGELCEALKKYFAT